MEKQVITRTETMQFWGREITVNEFGNDIDAQGRILYQILTEGDPFSTFRTRNWELAVREAEQTFGECD